MNDNDRKMIDVPPDPEVIPKGMAGNIPVYCSFDKIIPINQLKQHPQNPNTHPENQIKLLANIIQKQGWRQPITVSTRSGFIVKGHGRLMAAFAAGEQYVPVDYQFYETDEQEKADLLADNKIAELSVMDEEILSDILSDLKETDLEMILTGYSDAEIEELLSEKDEQQEPIEQNTAMEKYEIVVTCSSAEEQIVIYERLKQQGLAVSKKTTQML